VLRPEDSELVVGFVGKCEFGGGDRGDGGGGNSGSSIERGRSRRGLIDSLSQREAFYNQHHNGKVIKKNHKYLILKSLLPEKNYL